MDRRPQNNVKRVKGTEPWLSAALGFGNFVPGFIVGFMLGVLLELPKSLNPFKPSPAEEPAPSQKKISIVGRRPSNARANRFGSTSTAAEVPSGELKMVFVVRQDLRMGAGKIASQCARKPSIYQKMRLLARTRNALAGVEFSLGSNLEAFTFNHSFGACPCFQEQFSVLFSGRAQFIYVMRRGQRLLLRKWEDCGQPKIVVTCKNQHEMNELKAKAERANLPCFVVADAGRTQVAAGSQTVLAIGPGAKAHVDTVTRHLKLL